MANKFITCSSARRNEIIDFVLENFGNNKMNSEILKENYLHTCLMLIDSRFQNIITFPYASYTYNRLYVR